jgi:hypothetical protein
MGNFNFSLCNVHLRPEDSKSKTDSRYEIEDLGKCIGQLNKYNPDSTIILGDFNMSSCRYAPESSKLTKEKKTEFPPFVAGVWDSFDDKGYVHVVRNRYTNTSDNKQFDNIWLPKELYPKAVQKVSMVNPLGDKSPYEQSENVFRLQTVFVGEEGKEVIAKMTDHHLVFVDLSINVSEKSEFIKRVFEIDNSLKGLKMREYDGFSEPKASTVEPKTPEDRRTSINSNRGGIEVTPDDKDEKQDASTSDARRHFMLWNKKEQVLKNVTVSLMGGPDEKEHWAFSLLPRKLLQKPKDKAKAAAWTTMKSLEGSYFECKDKLKTLEAQWDALKSSTGDENEIKKELKRIRKEKKELNNKIDDQIISEFDRLIFAHFAEHLEQSSESGV